MILEGERIRLRPATRDDQSAYVRWFTDPEFRRYMGAGDDALQALASRPADQVNFSVELLDGRLIGLVMVTRVRTVNRNCELGVVAIGERDCWDKGYGTEMVKLALGYCFDELNMHQVYIRSIEYNERARRCYGRILPHEARHREGQWSWEDGRFWDQLYWDITEEEWRARKSH